MRSLRSLARLSNEETQSRSGLPAQNDLQGSGEVGSHELRAMFIFQLTLRESVAVVA